MTEPDLHATDVAAMRGSGPAAFFTWAPAGDIGGRSKNASVTGIAGERLN